MQWPDAIFGLKVPFISLPATDVDSAHTYGIPLAMVMYKALGNEIDRHNPG